VGPDKKKRKTPAGNRKAKKKTKATQPAKEGTPTYEKGVREKKGLPEPSKLSRKEKSNVH